MAASVNKLLISVGLIPDCVKTVKWGQTIDCSSMGIYFICTNKDPASSISLFKDAPIDEKRLINWIQKVPKIQVDGEPANVESLTKRLRSFWLPDENIIYIGETESRKGLKGRISKYYRTELGARKPHAGGHWIKTLEILEDLYVHYIPSENPDSIEKTIMNNFVEQVSDKTKNALFDSTLTLPFANLELEKGNIKKHGISNTKLTD